MNSAFATSSRPDADEMIQHMEEKKGGRNHFAARGGLASVSSLPQHATESFREDVLFSAFG